MTSAGNEAFKEWLIARSPGELPPAALLDGAIETESLLNVEINLDLTFATRLEFGKYMMELLSQYKPQVLLSEANDGLWNWLTIAYFAQFGKKTSKYWHYLVSRRGHSGSLAYRHLARTSFEMYWQHKDNSRVMLNVDMATWGDMAEQLTSRQNVAYNHGYIATANMLYFEDGKLRRGAAGRVPPVARRKIGDRRGRGGAARLALAVRRLCRTYDTHALDTGEMVRLLPKEFSGFATKKPKPG